VSVASLARKPVAVLVLLVTSLANCEAASACSGDDWPEMAWTSEGNGLSVGVPTSVQNFRVNGPLDVVLGVRNDTEGDIYCSMSASDTYAQMSDDKGHQYASFFPNDQISDAHRGTPVPLKRGEPILEHLSLMSIGIYVSEPGVYNVSVARSCDDAAKRRMHWTFTIVVTP